MEQLDANILFLCTIWPATSIGILISNNHQFKVRHNYHGCIGEFARSDACFDARVNCRPVVGDVAVHTALGSPWKRVCDVVDANAISWPSI
jgi:hypothetical protein